MSEPNKTEYDAAFLAGVSAAAPTKPDGCVAHTSVLPHGTRLVSLERYLASPVRKRGTATFTHEGGFNAYLKIHKQDSTTLFADVDEQTMTAVIDYHAEKSPLWGEHRAIFAPPKDKDWLTWMEKDDVPVPQLKFAQFIEDNLPLIVTPDSAELLEMIQHFEAHSDVKFKSAQRLRDGSKSLLFDEQAKGKVGQGQIDIPDEIELRLPVFRWGGKVEVHAKLRYRIVDGQLLLWYHLMRPQDVLDDAFQRLLDGVEVETALKPLFGTAPDTETMGAQG